MLCINNNNNNYYYYYYLHLYSANTSILIYSVANKPLMVLLLIIYCEIISIFFGKKNWNLWTHLSLLTILSFHFRKILKFTTADSYWQLYGDQAFSQKIWPDLCCNFEKNKEKMFFFFKKKNIYMYKQIQVIHRWIQNSALQLRSGLTVNRLLRPET